MGFIDDCAKGIGNAFVEAGKWTAGAAEWTGGALLEKRFEKRDDYEF